jgi:hypothetical protein
VHGQSGVGWVSVCNVCNVWGCEGVEDYVHVRVQVYDSSILRECVYI